MRQRFFAASLQWALLVVLGLGGSVAAAAKSETPQQVVQGVTDSVMSVIKADERALKDNPDEYFAKVRASLESTVSFAFIAQNVMGSYWNQASAAQRERFAETFTRSMVETLGKGLANYSGLKITTVPPEGEISVDRRVEVVQEVAAADGTTRIAYTMAQNNSGEWKLINVVLNGINLGKSFRDQFAQAMRQNDSNIDKVIATWAQQA